MFSSSGDNNHRDFWLVGGHKHWAVIPSGVIAGFPGDLPICLQTGTAAWGKNHIEYKHGRWLREQNKSTCELLHHKLGQSGAFYSAEEEGKLKLAMRLAPDTMLILRLVQNRKFGDFLTIVTMYPMPRHVDGSEIGRYLSEYRVNQAL